MDSLWALNVLSSRILLFSPSPQSIVFFIHRHTSASTFSPVLSFTNVVASYDTSSCAATVSLYIWVLQPIAPPTSLTTTLLSLSVLVGVGWFCYLVPLVHHRLHRPDIYVYLMGGGGVDTWSPSCTPRIFFLCLSWWVLDQDGKETLAGLC